MFKKFLFYTIYFLNPLLLVIVVYISSPVYTNVARFIPMFFGVTAFCLLNAQLVLSTRPKLLEKSLGLDKLYRFHSIMAPVAIVLAGIHQEIEPSIFPENLQTNFGKAALVIFVICAAFAFVLMTQNMLPKLSFIKNIQAYFKNKEFGKYNVQLLLHNFNVLAISLLFVHVMLSSSAQDPLVRTFYTLYFTVGIGFYLYHKIIRPSLFNKRFLVEKITAESASIVNLELRPVNGKNIAYDPGQFVFVKIADTVISGEEHPFSLTSQPANKKNITISIKKLGDWTSKVNQIKKESIVSIDGPYGKFSPVNYDCSNGIALIAGGIGIAPMLSILRHFAQSDREQKIILLWSVKTTEDFIYKKEFNKLLTEMKNFSFVPIVSHGNFDGERGRINKEILEKYIEENAYEADKLQYFYCGPEAMWRTVEEILSAMNIAKKQIHRESFSL